MRSGKWSNITARLCAGNRILGTLAALALAALVAWPNSSPAAQTPEVRTVENPTYAIVDRCMTCHAREGESESHAGPPPDRFHAALLLEKHPVEKFGCAVCHGGDPLATEKEAAHGRMGAGNEQLLTGLHTQSRCIRCHEGADVPGMEFLARGLDMIGDRACFACHEIPGGDRRERKAPLLAGVGNKVRAQWLTKWLLDPGSYSQSSRMPGFYLQEEEAQSIAAYLLSLDDGEKLAPLPEPGAPLDRAEARRLIERSACLDCHRMKGVGGNAPGVRAPDLSLIGDKVKPAWVARWLEDGPQHLQPGAGMPGFRFSRDEAQLIARYLTETFRSKHGDRDAESATMAFEPEQVEHGKMLYTALGCLNCHAEPGDPSVVKIGPDLREVGDRDVRGVYWPGMREDWNMGLTSYLRTKVSRPRAFSEGHRMPNFRLTPEQTEAIVVALLSFSKNPIDEESRIALERIPFEGGLPTGPAGDVFQRFQCLRCHALRGEHGQIAPDLGWQGDRVQREWLVRFMKDPYPIRPALTARMPRLGLTDAEVEVVADYMESVLWDDEVPDDPFGGEPPPPQLAARGESLFEDEYSCLDCHVVGDEGEIDGPDLSAVAERLRPGWLYQWILDPQRFYESDMDSQDVTEEDALAITAYLLSLPAAEETEP